MFNDNFIVESEGAGDRELDRFDHRILGRAGGEAAQCVDRALAIVAGASERIVHRAAGADEADRLGEILVGDAAAGDRVLPEGARRIVAARIGEDDGQRRRALC